MSKAFIFPGQASQSVGMGKSLSDNFIHARRVFEEVDDALDFRLSELMFEGSEGELTLTANAQPALMATSLAVIRVLEAEKGLDLSRDAAFVAGHSLGEYSALTAAGSLTIRDAARILRRRGKAMQKAVPVGEGAMAAIIGIDVLQAREITSEAARTAQSICEVANDNGGGQVVISGSTSGITQALEIAKNRGFRRVIVIPVSAPFHCALMQPAADVMSDAISEVTFKKPVAPLVSNVTATAVSDPEFIQALLLRQLTGTVRWRECVNYIVGEGVTKFIECGSGTVLTNLQKRIDPRTDVISIGLQSDIDKYSNFDN